MTTPRRKALIDSLWYVIPLAIGVLLNAVVRPIMAACLGGEMIRKGAGVRGSDTWWTFDAATRAEHPWRTGFLEMPHSAVALATMAVIAVLFVWRCFARPRG
ncbi:hypothetical protein ABC365_15420 [Brevundimonas sp. 3P9-tot-E]|uniref:hypothetical protein n=1 Tax=Brevundimonas TaxID=41275 RepID=UPI0019086C40|nr:MULTISPECIES: hypothetical protein [Brevundimonas]MBK1970393.1 hypothetical protein [Brevundimonas diminuta]MBK1974363.1 hypothetical protein [Brevundimonas diminuta]